MLNLAHLQEPNYIYTSKYNNSFKYIFKICMYINEFIK